MATNPYPKLTDYMTEGYWFDRLVKESKTPRAFDDKSITYNIDDLTPATQDLAETALDQWADIGDFTFTQVSGQKADINFKDDHLINLPGPLARTANYLELGTIKTGPSVADIGKSRVQIDDDWVQNYGTHAESYTYKTYVHEIGHALGLGHTGDYNGGASFPADAKYDDDSYHASVMSYFDQQENDKGASGIEKAYPSTPQIADIFAIKKLYGLDPSTRSGDNTYGYNTNTDNPSVFDSPLNAGTASGSNIQETTYTIYDTGGEDTLDFSQTQKSQAIDLTPGAASDVGGLKNGPSRSGDLDVVEGALIIAPQSTIENAVGGTAGDTLQGNGAANALVGNAGPDELKGGAGHDRLFGGAGKDKAFGGQGDDILVGGPGPDHLEGGPGEDTFRYRDGADGGAKETIKGQAGHDALRIEADADATSDLTGTDIAGVETLNFAGAATAARTLAIGSDGFEDLAEGGSGPLAVTAEASDGAGDTVDISMTGPDLDLSGVDVGAWPAGTFLVRGTFADETITGSQIDDTVHAGTGTDTVDLQAGDDHVTAGVQDQLDGGRGFDTVDYAARTFSGASIDLSAGLVFRDGHLKAAAFHGPGVDNPYIEQLSSFEAVQDSAGGNTLRGDAGDNRLIGNGGADVLQPNAGIDILEGGRGADTFVLEKGAGADNTIKDFADGTDTLDLSAFGYDSIGEVKDDVTILGDGLEIELRRYEEEETTPGNAAGGGAHGPNGSAPMGEHLPTEETVTKYDKVQLDGMSLSELGADDVVLADGSAVGLTGTPVVDGLDTLAV